MVDGFISYLRIRRFIQSRDTLDTPNPSTKPIALSTHGTYLAAIADALTCPFDAPGNPPPRNWQVDGLVHPAGLCVPPRYRRSRSAPDGDINTHELHPPA